MKETLDEAFKVFEEKDGEPHFMFHGVGGSKKVPFNKWLKAEKKRVRDGSGGKWYTSGFHVYESIDDLKSFTKTLKKNISSRFIVLVLVQSLKKKSKRSRAHLADKIMLTRNAWDNRISCQKVKNECER